MRIFPVIYTNAGQFSSEVRRLRELSMYAFVIGVPWEMLEEHAAQVSSNHDGKSLQTLSEPGLSAMEVVAILRDCGRWEINQPKNQPFNHCVLLNMIEVWRDDA